MAVRDRRFQVAISASFLIYREVFLFQLIVSGSAPFILIKSVKDWLFAHMNVTIIHHNFMGFASNQNKTLCTSLGRHKGLENHITAKENQELYLLSQSNFHLQP
jgi:hypothetical protein